MQQEVIETVMQDLLEEQKIANIKLDEVTQKLVVAEMQIGQFKEHLLQVKLAVPPIDTLRIETTLSNHLKSTVNNIDGLKAFITNERKKQKFKEALLYWWGWILLTILSSALLVWAIMWPHIKAC